MLYLSAVILAMAIAVGSSATQTPQSRRQSLKAAEQAAKTTLDYEQIATYFEGRSTEYRKLSEEQDKTLRQETAHPTLGSKYPSAADRTRRLAEYYSELSSKAHRQSEHFKSLANQAKAQGKTR